MYKRIDYKMITESGIALMKNKAKIEAELKSSTSSSNFFKTFLDDCCLFQN